MYPFSFTPNQQESNTVDNVDPKTMRPLETQIEYSTMRIEQVSSTPVISVDKNCNVTVELDGIIAYMDNTEVNNFTVRMPQALYETYPESITFIKTPQPHTQTKPQFDKTVEINKIIDVMRHLGVSVLEVPERNLKFVMTPNNISCETLDRPEPSDQDMLVKLFEMQSKLNDYTFKKMNICPAQIEYPTLTMKDLQTQAQNGTDNSANGDVNIWLNKYLWALMTECEEVKAELLTKWWSVKEINIPNIQKEVVDTLHFFISMAITSGFDAPSLVQAYMEKNAENFRRLDSGYAPSNS